MLETNEMELKHIGVEYRLDSKRIRRIRRSSLSMNLCATAPKQRAPEKPGLVALIGANNAPNVHCGVYATEQLQTPPAR